MRTPSRGRRVGREGAPGRGFTLIELLVAIVIISALIALLLPAIGRSMATARTAQVQSEISRLNSAIADFKAKHSVNPPSSITLHETAANWAGDPRSVGIIRQLWPQFDFTLDRDINGNGVVGDTIGLTLGECLVFFLGGVVDYEDNNGNNTLDGGEDSNGNGRLDWYPRGFSQNPADPFALGGSNREGPYFEFDINRFVDFSPADGSPEYVDTLPNQTSPYLYYSAYDGQGYLAAEAVAPGLTSVYLQGPNSPWNPQTFQIISPGSDATYGTGGPFNPDTADADLAVPAREAERDNLTNFHNGQLAP